MNELNHTDKINFLSKGVKWGWGILVTLTVLLVINGLHLYLFIVETAQEKTISILLTGFGILALVTSVDGYRNRSKTAVYGMWVVFFVMMAVSLHMFRYEQNLIGSWYAALAAFTLAGILLVRKGSQVKS